MPSQEKICIVNVRIFDGQAIKPAGSVHIAEGKIAKITGETTYPKDSEAGEFRLRSWRCTYSRPDRLPYSPSRS